MASTVVIVRSGMLLRRDRTPQPDGRQDRQLGLCVPTVDVGARVRLGVAQLLRFPQRGVERHAARFHAREDVVAGSVQDSRESRNRRSPASPCRRPMDDRNAARDGRLEPELHVPPLARAASRSPPPCAMTCLLAVTTDLPASSARRIQPVAGSSSADQLHHDVRVRARARRRCPPSRWTSSGHPVDPLAVDPAVVYMREPEAAVRPVAQDARHGAADRAEADQCDRERGAVAAVAGHRCAVLSNHNKKSHHPFSG